MSLIKKKRPNFLLSVLFIIYMALLVWIIVFKLQFSISELDRVRSINLIPFHYSNEIGGRFHLTEILENIAIFIPLGIYLCMFKKEPKFSAKVLFILGTSAVLEIVQYILAIGRSDITDLLTNTCGGLLGVAIYLMIGKVFQSKKRTNRFITVIASIVTILVTGGLIVLLIAN